MQTYAYFENIEHHIIERLLKARESVKICVAWINAGIYEPILQELAEKGVKVEVLFNADNANKKHGLKRNTLYKTYAIQTRTQSALMHDKFCIIDHETVITGSYNWSKSAADHFENILIVERDYALVKSFMHEFDDLVAYYVAFNTQSISKCPKCGSHSFILGMVGAEEGLYESTQLDVWRVCSKNHHVEHLCTMEEHHLFTQLGLKDAPEFHLTHEMTKESMLDEYQFERQAIEKFPNFFSENLKHFPNTLPQKAKLKIHAIGRPGYDNWMEMMEYNEPGEPCINVVWKDTFFRKIVSDKYLMAGSGGIEKILAQYSV